MNSISGHFKNSHTHTAFAFTSEGNLLLLQKCPPAVNFCNLTSGKMYLLKITAFTCTHCFLNTMVLFLQHLSPAAILSCGHKTKTSM